MTTRLPPFFSYYGSKHRIIDRYPAPVQGRIVEPFAGSAAYATRYYWLPVTLYDANPKVSGVWDYLTKASRADLMSLPVDVEDVRHLPIAQEARWLVGFWIARARAQPAHTASPWVRSGAATAGQIWSAKVRDRLSCALDCIRHWKVVCQPYESVHTHHRSDWFVDPPYQGRAGKQYRAFGSAKIDYSQLGEWCIRLPGHTIVCESLEASWLPFRPLCANLGLKGTKTEAVWVSRGQQTELFA